jgi:hypothetical protein
MVLGHDTHGVIERIVQGLRILNCRSVQITNGGTSIVADEFANDIEAAILDAEVSA